MSHTFNFNFRLRFWNHGKILIIFIAASTAAITPTFAFKTVRIADNREVYANDNGDVLYRLNGKHRGDRVLVSAPCGDGTAAESSPGFYTQTTGTTISKIARDTGKVTTLTWDGAIGLLETDNPPTSQSKKHHH